MYCQEIFFIYLMNLMKDSIYYKKYRKKKETKYELNEERIKLLENSLNKFKSTKLFIL